jgi:hypothetical protein
LFIHVSFLKNILSHLRWKKTGEVCSFVFFCARIGRCGYKDKKKRKRKEGIEGAWRVARGELAVEPSSLYRI